MCLHVEQMSTTLLYISFQILMSVTMVKQNAPQIKMLFVRISRELMSAAAEMALSSIAHQDYVKVCVSFEKTFTFSIQEKNLIDPL